MNILDYINIRCNECGLTINIINSNKESSIMLWCAYCQKYTLHTIKNDKCDLQKLKNMIY